MDIYKKYDQHDVVDSCWNQSRPDWRGAGPREGGQRLGICTQAPALAFVHERLEQKALRANGYGMSCLCMYFLIARAAGQGVLDPARGVGGVELFLFICFI